MEVLISDSERCETAEVILNLSLLVLRRVARDRSFFVRLTSRKQVIDDDELCMSDSDDGSLPASARGNPSKPVTEAATLFHDAAQAH